MRETKKEEVKDKERLWVPTSEMLEKLLCNENKNKLYNVYLGCAALNEPRLSVCVCRSKHFWQPCNVKGWEMHSGILIWESDELLSCLHTLGQLRLFSSPTSFFCVWLLMSASVPLSLAGFSSQEGGSPGIFGTWLTFGDIPSPGVFFFFSPRWRRKIKKHAYPEMPLSIPHQSCVVPRGGTVRIQNTDPQPKPRNAPLSPSPPPFVSCASVM